MSRTLGLLILAAGLAACASSGEALPDSRTAVQPVVQVVERYIYVPIDSVLTGTEFIAEGPLSMCPQVAAQRKAALQRCNAKLTQIGGQQGTAVELDDEADQP